MGGCYVGSVGRSSERDAGDLYVLQFSSQFPETLPKGSMVTQVRPQTDSLRSPSSSPSSKLSAFLISQSPTFQTAVSLDLTLAAQNNVCPSLFCQLPFHSLLTPSRAPRKPQNFPSNRSLKPPTLLFIFSIHAYLLRPRIRNRKELFSTSTRRDFKPVEYDKYRHFARQRRESRDSVNR